MVSRFVAFAAFLLLSACGGGGTAGSTTPPQGSGPQTPPTPPSVSVAGAVQKGPFLVGSTVLVNKLDALGHPTDSTIVTEIEDSVGSFSFKSSSAGPVQIVASGYYFSELTGQVSSGTLTLKALYEVGSADRQTAYVNIMTHLINDRVLELIADPQLTWANALAQAEREFIDAFSDALPVSGLGPFSALSVYNSPGSDDVGNAYLLALSAGFYKYAAMQAEQFGTATDAELTLILNQISDDFAADGTIQQPDFMDDFIAAIRSLSPSDIAANLRSRSIVDFPQGLDVPDISRFLNLCAGAAACAWRSGAPIPAASRGHAAVGFDGKIYLFGGAIPGDDQGLPLSPLSPTAFRSTRMYDPVANSWSVKQPMPVGAYDLEAHVVGDKIYVLLGYGAEGFRNEVLEYDPLTDSWSQKTPSPTYRYEFTSAVVNDRIYVVGGQGTIDDGPWESGKPWSYKSHVAIYDPRTDAWSTGQPTPMPLAASASCVAGDDIYVFGGRAADSTLQASTLVYSTTSNSWSARSGMSAGREGHDCVRVNDQFYVIGGRTADGAPLNLVHRYDPATDTWEVPTYMPTARYWFDATTVADEIFIFGGMGAALGPSVPLLDAVEILDPMM